MRTSPISIGVLSIFVAFSAAPSAAQGAGAVQLVKLKTGGVHEAALRSTDDGFVALTALGSFDVPKSGVESKTDLKADRELIAAAVAGLHPANIAGQYAAAKLAASRGLWSEARRRLNLVFEVDPDHPGARALATEWSTAFRLNEHEAGADENLRRATNEWFETGAADWVGAAMVAEKVRGKPRDLVFRPAMKALKADKAPARWVAAQVLAAFSTQTERIRPLYRSAILDADASVRRECVRSLKVTEDPVFARLFSKSLTSRNQEIRMRAADALGELGMKEGLTPLINLLAGDSPVPPRANVVFTTQTAYVKDFDVEVAQGAVIADPVVDVVQEGVDLDVAVVAVNIERGRYFQALRRIAKRDFGRDLGLWRQFAK